MPIDRSRAKTAAKYLVAGIPGLCLFYTAFYGLTEFFGVWYIVSSLVGFVLNVTSNFLIHKFWTFENRGSDHATEQAARYLTLALSMLVVNTLAMYILVDMCDMNYLVAQGILTVVLTIIGFFISSLIFKRRDH